ncbi:SH3 domain-containing protein [Rhodobacterales bacterium HKCCE2091]|nr:SH3 domain-containing protein [Rhodobacterales bacterium HKCCE2091]
MTDAIDRRRGAGIARFLAFLVAAIVSTAAASAQDVRTVDVRFAAGSSGASYSDSITGYEAVEYELDARAGQYMTVEMTTSNPSAYFNIWAPGTETALFIGSSSGTDYEGVLPRSGTYRVQVYLMRNAARRGETASYRIAFGVTGQPGGQPQPQPMPLPPPDYADGDAGGPDWWQIRTSTGSPLNIRSGPGRQFAVLTSLPSGTVLRNHGCQTTTFDGRWCEVGYDTGRGWAAASFLREAPPPGPGTPPAPAPGAGAGGSGGATGWFVVQNLPASDRLVLRGGPSGSERLVGQAEAGALLRNLGCRDVGAERWCQVENRSGTLTGWANARFLGPSAGPAPARPATGADPTVYRRSSGEYEVRFATGCALLFDRSGSLVTAGPTCTAAQSIRAVEALDGYRVANGL